MFVCFLLSLFISLFLCLIGCKEEDEYPKEFVDQANALQKFVLPTIRNVATAIQDEQVEYDTICETSSANTIAIINALEASFCKIVQTNVSFLLLRRRLVYSLEL